ncbi:alpha-ketoglutarate-dependent dioxygenase AlkB [Enhygromyxa salina]|uniref:2OG-Fe(II) oxygenase superfamily protein n=1 Tax=Enhygromyxa salina TaxID=215803 RepID=A0A2S9YJ02_9BACT|nr:alpha-ketoglutarate-dependent dioxygenase AlkB [Enhygromyxa salina]PRQ05087.1 2OG-Fe(II) oxygenase superfamily protein [Enhygromyxa salina]
MSTRSQLALDLAPSTQSAQFMGSQDRAVGSFGLCLDHRALFDGLASEWLEPSQHGHLLVRGEFARPAEAYEERSANLILVRAHVELRADADHRVWSLREGAWVELSLRELDQRDGVLWWPGPLSTHGLTLLEVATDEERARLVGIARQVSNLNVPPVSVSHPNFMAETLPAPPVSGAAPRGSAFHDRVRGAAAMGWWALPRTEPWFDLMVASFNGAPDAFTDALELVEAPWLAELPWRVPDSERLARRDPDTVLWSAACRVAQTWTDRASTALVAAITEASIAAAPELTDPLLAWGRDTRSILRAERDLDTDAGFAVGAALQLVLTRSAPERYKTWARDHRAIPPAVWWTGALLSGLLCGYRDLATTFRGNQSLREFLAHKLLEPEGAAARLSWTFSNDRIHFLANGQTFTTKPRTARSHWYNASLDNERNHAAALALVKQLGWPCVVRELVLRDQVLGIRGGGSLEVTESELRTAGHVRLSIPRDVEIQDSVDHVAFRRSLVTQGGDLREPPLVPALTYDVLDIPEIHVSDVGIDRAALPLTSARRAVGEVPGLFYVSEFLTQRESEEIVEHIDRAPWLNELKRRVQHYGWKYNYRAREVTRDMKIGPLPAWAKEIAERMAKAKLLPWIADQMIVNEYVETQGISKHIDCVPCFEAEIAMISLVEPWHMRFRPPKSKQKVDIELEVCSLAIMTGPARYDWTHEIPSRKTEPGGRIRKRRISLTFRKVKLA